MDKDTLISYGFIVITLIISMILIMFAAQHNKDIKTKTENDVNMIVSMATEQEEIIYE